LDFYAKNNVGPCTGLNNAGHHLLFGMYFDYDVFWISGDDPGFFSRSTAAYNPLETDDFKW